MIDRDELYRATAGFEAEVCEAADRAPSDDKPHQLVPDDVSRYPGGAWVLCWVRVDNTEVAELLDGRRELIRGGHYRNPREAFVFTEGHFNHE